MIIHNITTIIDSAIRTDNANKIIFFIENLSHFRFVEKIFDYYLTNDFEITLLCLENFFESDITISTKIDIVVLKNDIEKIKILKNLKGKVFITTTPSIGSSIFPKSQVSPKEDRPKYLYFFHSLVSPGEMYVKNSFKNFDYIFSPSNTITEQLKPLVSDKVKIFTTGYLLFDQIQFGENSKEFNDRVLIAPTWGKAGVDEIISNLEKITNFISSQSLKPVFRPHPMTDINEFKINPNISLDLDKDLKNLQDYKHLITDYSGIALEFFYLTKRSTIFLEVQKKIKRKIGKKEKNFLLIENEMRTVIGEAVSINEINQLKTFPDIDVNSVLSFVQKINYSSNSLKQTIEILNAENLN